LRVIDMVWTVFRVIGEASSLLTGEKVPFIWIVFDCEGYRLNRVGFGGGV